MTLSFKPSNLGEKLTFQDVKEDQFFVDQDGRLCQKGDETFYCMIAESDGTPWLVYYCDEDGFSDMFIDRILPHVDKIEF
jgi:hypothetical protein